MRSKTQSSVGDEIGTWGPLNPMRNRTYSIDTQSDRHYLKVELEIGGTPGAKPCISVRFHGDVVDRQQSGSGSNGVYLVVEDRKAIRAAAEGLMTIARMAEEDGVLPSPDGEQEDSGRGLSLVR